VAITQLFGVVFGEGFADEIAMGKVDLNIRGFYVAVEGFEDAFDLFFCVVGQKELFLHFFADQDLA
jgi:hypothetical protein